jgi:hypothetical protein
MNPPRIHAPKAIPSAVESLSKYLKSQIAEGAEFKIDQTIQCAWMWFKVGTDEQGQPTVLAPQTGVMPMSFVADSSDALNLVLTQRYVCDSFSVECGWCNAVRRPLLLRTWQPVSRFS